MDSVINSDTFFEDKEINSTREEQESKRKL